MEISSLSLSPFHWTSHEVEKKIYISFLRILGTNNHGRNENILCREITILIDVDIILCHCFPLISFDLNHRRWKYPLSSSILVYTRATSPSHRRNCSSSVTLSSMTDWRRVGRCVAASTRWKQNTPTPCFSNDLGVVCPLLDASEREKTGRLFPWKISEFSLPPGMSGTEHLTRAQVEIDCVTRIVTSFVDHVTCPSCFNVTYSIRSLPESFSCLSLSPSILWFNYF